MSTAGVIFRLALCSALRAPERYFHVAFWQTLADGALILVTVILRWDTWMIACRESSLYQPASDLPAWLMALLIAGMVVWLALQMRARARASERMERSKRRP